MVRGESSTGIDSPNGGKLQISIDDTVFVPGADVYKSFYLKYEANKSSETKTIIITNIGTDTVYFPDIYPAFTNKKVVADYSNYQNTLEPGASTSISFSYNPSEYFSTGIYIYNSSLVCLFEIEIVLVKNPSSTPGAEEYLSISAYNDICHTYYRKSWEIDSGTDESNFEAFEFIAYDQCPSSSVAKFTVRNNTHSPMFFTGSPIVWITGEDADDFSLDCLYSTNLELTPSSSFSFSVTPSESSKPERNAIIHISTDLEGHEIINIPIKALFIEPTDYFNELGYAYVNYDVSTNFYDRKIIQDGKNGCYLVFTVRDDNSQPKLAVYHIDSKGKSELIKNIEIYSTNDDIWYVSCSDGVLDIYIHGTSLDSIYGYNYVKLTLDTITMETSASRYEYKDLASIIPDSSINGKDYKKVFEYNDYLIGLNGSNYNEFDVYKDSTLVASIRDFKVLNNTGDYFCLSGDYFLYSDSHCIRRVETSIKDILDELQLHFGDF